jgi:hypothetical protein
MSCLCFTSLRIAAFTIWSIMNNSIYFADGMKIDWITARESHVGFMFQIALRHNGSASDNPPVTVRLRLRLRLRPRLRHGTAHASIASCRRQPTTDQQSGISPSSSPPSARPLLTCIIVCVCFAHARWLCCVLGASFGLPVPSCGSRTGPGPRV